MPPWATEVCVYVCATSVKPILRSGGVVRGGRGGLVRGGGAAGGRGRGRGRSTHKVIVM